MELLYVLVKIKLKSTVYLFQCAINVNLRAL